MTWFISLVLAGSFYTPAAFPGPGAGDLGREAFATAVPATQDETIDKTYPLNPNGRVSVSNINGAVEVTGWDQPEVRLIAKKIANSADRLKDVEIDVASTSDSFRVSVDYKRWKGKWVRGDSLYVNFKLMVPRTAVVNEIESVNGKVTVEGLSNVTVVSAVNGAVKGSELKGKVKLSTVNGSVIATMVQVGPQAEISLETVNGSAEVRLPSNVNATVKADSVNGSIRNDFGLPVKKGKYVGRDLYGRIGSGTAKVKLTSVNGSISISRLEDGFPVNPVENLLPQKTSDDFDDAFEENLRASIEAARKVSIDAELTEDDARAVAELEKAALVNAETLSAEAAKIAAESVRAALSEPQIAVLDEQALKEALSGFEPSVIAASRAPFILEDSRTIPVKDNPTIEVFAYGSNVSVKGWEKSEVSYRVSRLARGVKSPVRGIKVSTEDNVVRLKVDLFDAPASNEVLEQVRVEVLVPQNSNLNIRTDREIRLEGVIGGIELSGKYGRINVRDAGGHLNLKTKSGTVRVIGFDGKLASEAMTADQYFEGAFESILSVSGRGKVYLTVPESAGAMIRTNSMGVAVEGDGERGEAGELKLEKESEGLWKLGNGGPEYSFNFQNGKLIVRSIQTIKS